MPENSDKKSPAERAAAFRTTGPRLEDLILLPEAVTRLEWAYSLTKHEATRFLLDELWNDPTTLPLHEASSSGRVYPVDGERVPMDAEALKGRIPGSNATHYPSKRDHLLGNARMAAVFGHMLGSVSHPNSLSAGALGVVRADFEALYIKPSPAMQALLAAAQAAPPPPAAAPGEPPAGSTSAVPALAGVLSPADVPAIEKARREAQVRAFKRTRAPGRRWRAEDLAELLRQYQILREIGNEWRKAELAHAFLAKLWGITPASVRVYLSKARADAEAASKARQQRS